MFKALSRIYVLALFFCAGTSALANDSVSFAALTMVYSPDATNMFLTGYLVGQQQLPQYQYTVAIKIKDLKKFDCQGIPAMWALGFQPNLSNGLLPVISFSVDKLVNFANPPNAIMTGNLMGCSIGNNTN